MSGASSPSPDRILGEIANPPFVRLPDPTIHFRQRAQRFAVLSQSHDLASYLRFMAELAEAQHQCQDVLPEPQALAPEACARARAFAMPPIDRGKAMADPAFDATFERFLVLAVEIDMPVEARRALDRVRGLDAGARGALARDVLAEPAAPDALAERVYAAAALQVHFARLAARLDAGRLVPVGEGVCPACGGAPVCSVVVGWQGAHNTRFCVCSLCAALWHVVRIKCVLCGSTKGIAYHEIEGGPGAGVRAETCEACGRYVKILQQQADPALDPVADDVATLGLDLLVREAGYRRGAINPFLLGY